MDTLYIQRETRDNSKEERNIQRARLFVDKTHKYANARVRVSSGVNFIQTSAQSTIAGDNRFPYGRQSVTFFPLIRQTFAADVSRCSPPIINSLARCVACTRFHLNQTGFPTCHDVQEVLETMFLETISSRRRSENYSFVRFLDKGKKKKKNRSRGRDVRRNHLSLGHENHFSAPMLLSIIIKNKEFNGRSKFSTY